MTPEQAALAKLQYIPAVPYRVLDKDEVERFENERKIEQLRKQRRMTQLREEYRHIRNYKVVLVHPQDGTVNKSFSLEELFEMFTLTQDWRDAVL
jgi:hypothetical protein